jgi:hypothetical protein
MNTIHNFCVLIGVAFGVSVEESRCGVPLIIRMKTREGKGMEVFASFANKHSGDAVVKAISAVDSMLGGHFMEKFVEVEIGTHRNIDGDSCFASTACAAISLCKGTTLDNYVVTSW